MRKTICTLLSPLFLFTSMQAQTFQRTYGGTFSETPTSIQPTKDGNYILSGVSTSFTNSYDDFYLNKVTSSGSLLWSKVYGGTKDEFSYYSYTCTDGGFILTGLTDSYGAGGRDIFLVRTDSDGNLLWSRTIGGTGDDYGWYVVQAADGGFVTAGTTKSFGGGGWDGYLAKVNSAGTLQWAKAFGGTNGENFYGMSNTSDGGFIITGLTSTNSFGSSDLWLVKTDSDGDTLWTRSYGKTTEDAGNAVIPTSDGGYAIAGDVHIDPNNGAHNACLLKTDSQGTLQWVTTYGSIPGSEVAYDLRQTPDNGYFLLSNTNGFGSGGKEVLLIKTNSTGGLDWANTYGGSNTDDVWLFTKTPDEGNMIVAATLSFGAGQYDAYLIRTDSAGNSSCNTDSCSPAVNNPVLQSQSGTQIVSGGVATSPAAAVTAASTITNDPCLLIGVNENADPSSDVVIYPNPFLQGTTFLIPDIPAAQGLELILYDVYGKLARKQVIPKGVHDHRMERGTLASGIYFYKLMAGDEMIAAGKVVAE